MFSLSALWDRTTAFITDHFGAILPIAALGLFLPTAALQSLMAYAPGKPLVLLIVLICGLAASWAQLVLIALSIEPAGGRAGAVRLATRRFPVQIGLSLLIGLAVGLAAAPFGIAIGIAVADGGAASEPGHLPALGAATAAFLLLYGLVFLVVALWIGARLMPLSGVVVAERNGIGAFARTFRLTRGTAIRLIGLILLYVIVSQVASLAVMTVAGSIAGLFLDTAIAQIVSKVFAAGVGTIFGVIAAIYLGQLYLALRDRADGTLDLR